MKDNLETFRKFLFGIRDDVEGKASLWIEWYMEHPVTVEEAHAELNNWQSPGKFTILVANLAYFQFGVRNYNKANRLVTRKWIRNLLETKDYKDLRITDKIKVIDEALHLSFVPSATWDKVSDLVETELWKELVPHEADASP